MQVDVTITAPIEVTVTPPLKVVEVLKERGPPGPRGPVGVINFVELTSDHTVTNSETMTAFKNTNATGQISIDFSLAEVNDIYEFWVTNPYGFSLIPTGTIYISGEPFTGPVYADQFGAMCRAIVIDSQTIFLQTFGPWSNG